MENDSFKYFYATFKFSMLEMCFFPFIFYIWRDKVKNIRLDQICLSYYFI